MKNKVFDQFSVSVIKAVDSIRSSGNGVDGEYEPRINAFYRALGLPAVNSSDNDIYIDPKNNGNAFYEDELSISDEDRQKLIKRSFAAITNTKPEEIELFLDSNNYSITDALEKRSRGTIFPMIVDNNILVYPRKRRVGPAFASDFDLKDDKNIYRRPLLEMIISFKLSGDGLFNSDKKSNAEITDEIIKQMPIILEDINNNFAQFPIEIGKYIQDSAARMGKARIQYGADVLAEYGNIPSQKLRTQENSNKLGKIDIIKRELLAQESEKIAKLSLFNFDDTLGGEDSSLKNMREAVLANEVLGIAIDYDNHTSILDFIPDELEKLEVKIKNDIRIANKELDNILGIYSGLGTVEVFAIIYAMFSIETDYLISLLNKDSVRFLNKSLGTNEITRKYGVVEAISKLQEEVKAKFEEISLSIGNSKEDDKQQNK